MLNMFERLKAQGASDGIVNALSSLADEVWKMDHEEVDKIAEDKSLLGAIRLVARVADSYNLFVGRALPLVGICAQRCGERIAPQVENEATVELVNAAARFEHAMADAIKMLMLDKAEEIRKISERVHDELDNEAKGQPEEDKPEPECDNESCQGCDVSGFNSGGGDEDDTTPE